jgi:hypothetical protein
MLFTLTKFTYIFQPSQGDDDKELLREARKGEEWQITDSSGGQDFGS